MEFLTIISLPVKENGKIDCHLIEQTIKKLTLQKLEIVSKDIIRKMNDLKE